MLYLPPFLLEIALIANRRQCSSSTTIISRPAATTLPIRIRRQVASLSADNTPDIMPTSSKSKRKRTTTTEHDDEQQQEEQRPWYHKFTQGDPLYTSYMSNEWSHEKQTDNELFEKLCLEGAQAGLSWRTILHKREAYRRAFHEFDINKVASMTASDIDNLMMLQPPKSKDNTKSNNTSSQEVVMVVRHRGKLESVIHNAKIIQKLKANGIITTSFSSYVWSFVNNKPILNSWKTIDEMPSKTTESETMSRELKKHGFKFVGPTTCYSLMQSCGLVIDHVVDSEEWVEAEKRLKTRRGGYQRR
jgi:DNA-3-methyladenine glycosylase I